MFRLCLCVCLCVCSLPQIASAQVAKFRLEVTDLSGSPIDTVTVGDQFLLNSYAQQVGGFDGDPADAGVFAGYLDINYDGSLVSIASDEIAHGPLYSNGPSGDLSTSGFIDNIGGFSSSDDPLDILPVPPGPDEQMLFSVSFQADAAGELSFVGSDSLSHPVHEVLVWTSLEPVPASDIDFGAEELRIDFGSLNLSIQPVPEPHAACLLSVGLFGLAARLRKRRSV